MIPTPAKRRHCPAGDQKQPPGDDPGAGCNQTEALSALGHERRQANATPPSSDDEIDEGRLDDDMAHASNQQQQHLMFNGLQVVGDERRRRLACHNSLGLTDEELEHQHELDELVGLQMEPEEEEDEFDYLRLDTIVEEDELSECSVEDPRRAASDKDNEPLLRLLKHRTSQLPANGTGAGNNKPIMCDQRAELNHMAAANSDTRPLVSITHGEQPTPRPLAETGATYSDHLIISSNNNSTRKSTSPNNSMPPQDTETSQATTNIDDSNRGANNRISINNNNYNNTTADSKAKCDIAANNTIGQQQQQTKAKMQQQQHHQCNQQLPLPSTNRLISEHQVRQQQALFRCLAERQKMMDELGAGQRVDLMSAASLGSSLRNSNTTTTTTTSQSGRSRRHRRRSRSISSSSTGADGNSGVPLSAVDLSSMSDRMLDELLGHIASASSSSLSSNGESLDSSDLSTEDDAEDDDLSTGDDDDETRAPRSSRAAHLNAPNVIGVHEDERTRTGCGQTNRQLNCRDTHRRSGNNGRHDEDDDDDDHNDHELVVHVQPTSGGSGDLTDSSLSPGPNNSGAMSHERRCHEQATAAGAGSSRLEQYFTSNLVNGHDFSDGAQEADPRRLETQDATGGNKAVQSVEEVLLRMLEALNEIGTDEQEQLNDLLERGFAHLEQLLNCSLAPGSSSAVNTGSSNNTTSNNNQTTTQHRSQPNLAQKLISTSKSQQLTGSQSTMLSKDSDYGSDTQSADCFSQFNDHTSSDNGNNLHQSTRFGVGSVNGADLSESPSPTSLTTNASSTSAPGSHTAPSTTATAATAEKASAMRGQSGSTAASLSPLAIELSFRLAESLHRLAQQQAARRAGADSPIQQLGDLEGALSTTKASGATPSKDSTASSTPIEMERATPPTKRSPMKSIVMINATGRSPSANSIMSSSSASSAVSPAQPPLTPVEVVAHSGGHARNMTPTIVGGEPPDSNNQANKPTATATTRQHFKTRVNIGSGQVSNCVIVNGAEPPAGNISGHADTTAGTNKNSSPGHKSAPIGETKAPKVLAETRRRPPLESSENIDNKSSDRGEPEVQANPEKSQVVKVTSSIASASQAAVAFERRRSSRSSLRRRPSFSGSTTSQTSVSREPRPGSPLPRPLLSTVEMGSASSRQQVAGVTQAGSLDKESEFEKQKQKQKQLQRALILAQKYNYSPAKLAASKLSSKLQLKDHLASSGSHHHYQTGPAIAINGSQTLNGQANVKEHLTTSGSRTQDRQLPSDQRSCRQLQQQPISITGQVQLDISYFAKSGSLTIHVLQCSQLAPVSKRRTTSNPYVKLYLLPDKSKSGKRKSTIHRNQLDPKFDEKFTFGPLQLAEFDNRILWLSVWHKDRLGRNEFLGEILLPLQQIRQQLLTSDLCQSTAPKWYQLADRQQLLAATRDPQTRTDTASSMDSRWKRSLTRGATTSSSNGKPDIYSNSHNNTLEKLDELQRKAARLTTAVAQPTTMNVSLGPQIEPGPNRPPITGQLFVALKFVADDRRSGLACNGKSSLEGELQVMIKEARNIGGFDLAPLSLQASLATTTTTNNTDNQKPGMQHSVRPPTGSLPNPFCKCYLLASNGQRLAKQKTQHLKRTVNPRWDHKCQFISIRLSNLASQAIEIHMFNRDSILVSNNEYLGGVRLCRASPISGSSTISSTTMASNELGADSTSITSEQSNSDIGAAQRAFSRQDSSESGTSFHHHQTSHTLKRPQNNTDELDDGALCSERESRLWNQMLARPGIWVYGELKLRQLRPLVVNRATNRSSSITTTNISSAVTTRSK